ncbi:EAL domain-containing protein [Desulfopila sp. IMCC35008]|uniref:EAL domain-containing protein n=1 Tax=Desulfopila sp. IMCC35008 TaxID=2653858 RepID=UPI0013D6F04D|nr:EAL domain-containing protein [Desulfopila sp. IMCC35008]
MGKSWRRNLLPRLFLLLLGLLLTYSQGLQRMDRFVYDAISSRVTRPPSESIVILAIDELSLSQYGQWPWPRRVHADLIDKLSIGGAGVIGFDIIFAEPDRRNGQDDILLAEAVSRSGRVIMPVFAEWNRAGKGLNLTEPIESVRQGTAGLGHVDFELDSDGIMRRTFLRGGLGSPNWDAFALSMLRFGSPESVQRLPGKRNKNLAGAASGNWVRDYEVLLPFAGKPGHFRQLSYAEFMAPEFDPRAVRGKYVLVGTTASGLSDALPTPVSGESVPMSGVEINANLLDTLENRLAIVPMSIVGTMLLAALLISIPLFTFTLFSERFLLVIVGGSLFVTLCITVFLLVKMQVWFPPVAVLVTVALSYPVWMWDRLESLLRKLFKERERAFVTLHSIGDGVITTNIDCLIEYLNPAAEKLTGYRNAEAIGLRVNEIFPVLTENEGEKPCTIVRECIDKSEIIHMQEEAVFYDRSGNEHIVQVTAGPLMDDAGNSLGAVFGISDVTEKKQALKRLTYQATHDHLTALPNRSLLFDRLHLAITRAHRAGKSVAILFLDLDNFKKVNDQLGHSGGDVLLKMVGKRLKEACRSGDTVARLGGDEFVILLEELTDLRVTATVANKFIHLLEPPFHVAGNEFFITGSIGISVYPKDGTGVDELVKHADIAMYEAKKSGRNNYLFFSDEMNDLIQKKLRLEADLRSALSGSDLQLYYQPQVRIRDNKIIGVEALLRWIQADRQVISPASFIPVAEESGLILPLSEWVMQTACIQAKLWQDELEDPLCIAVNISPRHFRDEHFSSQLSGIIEQAGLNPQNLDLEITESLIMQDVERSVDIMRKFKSLGGTISIDDFGTGYSSLSYLKKFPLDKLKIDKSFVDEIDSNPKDEGLAKTIITMGHGLGLTVVAEGVETRRQLEKLRELGCDIIQGYYYSSPLPADEMTQLLRKSQYISEPVRKGEECPI